VSETNDWTKELAASEWFGGDDRDVPFLIVLTGAGVGEMYRIRSRRTVIGRAEDAEIRLADDGISREHAEFLIEGRLVVVADLGSTNGTYHNGVRLDGPKVLLDGDKISVGSTNILKFTFHDEFDQAFQQELFHRALRDGLTGAFNAKYLLERLGGEFKYARRHRAHFSLLFLDIDNLKEVNDVAGHVAGDLLLREISDLLTSTLRTEDFLARTGGGEFVIMCRGTNRNGAATLGERLRASVENHGFSVLQKGRSVTVSIGIASLPDDAITTPDDLIKAADRAMCQAKETGRNRVSLHQSAAPSG
jgi:two-component system cell cycle response regulator